MQVLEKILQEITEEMRFYKNKYSEGMMKCGMASFRDYKAKGIAEGLRKARAIIRSHMNDDNWIPAEDPPKDDDYVLLSFSNFSVPLTGHYKEDKDGGGTYYIGDDTKSCISQDIIVNAWQPLPKSYQD